MSKHLTLASDPSPSADGFAQDDRQCAHGWYTGHMPEPAIKLENISKVFRYSKRHGWRGFVRPQMHKLTAVDDISLEIKSGESVGFIGPNGAGKAGRPH